MQFIEVETKRWVKWGNFPVPGRGETRLLLFFNHFISSIKFLILFYRTGWKETLRISIEQG
jgi:hypothetical protein